jgi:hypothetical protein
LFQRVLTATVKECTFDVAGMSTFLDSLRRGDIAQMDELAKEWAVEALRNGIGEDGKGIWWVVTNLTSVGFLAMEDVIAQVVQLVSNPKTGKVRYREKVNGRNFPRPLPWSYYRMCGIYYAPSPELNSVFP